MTPKFRAWLLAEKKMVRVSAITFFSIGKLEGKVMEILYLSESHNRFIKIWAKDPERFVLMQSTGAKDKNGAEIFEGDIIEHRYNSPLSGELVVHRFQVVWDEIYSRFCTIGIGLRHGVDLSISACSRHFEVIGNIYENPELLEEVEK
jgi:uncharacterized phage protein (TIGR01671 family)